MEPLEWTSMGVMRVPRLGKTESHMFVSASRAEKKIAKLEAEVKRLREGIQRAYSDILIGNIMRINNAKETLRNLLEKYETPTKA